MTLREKQSLFVELVGKLIDHAYAEGYELTFGEAYRTPEQAALNSKNGIGIKNSLHMIRLAVDFNLFKDGKFLEKTEDFTPLGEWWEKQSTDTYTCSWGGRFKTNPDGNHFSFEHSGVR